MFTDLLSSRGSWILVIFFLLCVMYRIFRKKIRRWWDRGEVIEGFWRQKRDRERHKDDDFGV